MRRAGPAAQRLSSQALRANRVIGAVGYIVEPHAVVVAFLQVEFLIRQGRPLHADVDFPFGPAFDCVCSTSATVKLHVLLRYGGIFHYSYQIMRKSQIMGYNDQ